jgi:hypothetical protein
MRPLGAVVIALAALAGLPRAAAAQLRTCVNVEAPPAEVAALTRLVKSEVDRHPSHHAATDDCQAYLTVEAIAVAGQAERWLTARINTQVPHRERVGADGVAAAVERLLTVVLANDPLVLRGPESNAWLKRQGRALEQRSVTHFGLEAYELGARAGGSFDTLPGLAFTLRREVSALHLGARLGGALAPTDAPGRLQLRSQFDAQVEAALYAAPEASTSLFASLLGGIVYQRFAGPAPLDGPGATGTATAWGLSLGLRGGVEAMRTADVRVLAFIQIDLPTFFSQDPDHGVVDQWVPSASIGAGVLF